MTSISRRNLAKAVPLALFVPEVLLSAPAEIGPLPEGWPVQEPAMAREMVGAAHGNVKRTRELVELHPSLVNATIDWGFGDWESALGGASHVGNREIAEFLITHGARPTLFSAAMLGQLDVVKATLAANPGAQKIRGPHSISLLAHAKAGGAAAEPVFKYLESLGDAGSPAPVPLTDEDRRTILGTWTFGPGANDTVEIMQEKNLLMFVRSGATGRSLTHLGNLEFFPAGANSVRIRFAQSSGETLLTVHDPALVLAARKP